MAALKDVFGQLPTSQTVRNPSESSLSCPFIFQRNNKIALATQRNVMCCFPTACAIASVQKNREFRTNLRSLAKEQVLVRIEYS